MDYTGTCYIGVVGPENEPGQCRDSIERIGRRAGDEGPFFARATKGYEARQTHLNKFKASKHDLFMLLDHDMKFEPTVLEQLRNHKLPFVSGLYMRRTFNPITPIWFRPFSGWPYEPWFGEIERGKLHKIGASGWGCMLVHRAVVEAVSEQTKAEWEILEDDMDVWPYDLQAVMYALKGLRSLADNKPDTSTLYPALEHHLGRLEKQIRPLRADYDIVGSDIRFPFFALQAGFQLWGDPDVRCGHILDYPLSPMDYDNLGPDNRAKMYANMRKRITSERRRLKQQLKEVTA